MDGNEKKDGAVKEKKKLLHTLAASSSQPLFVVGLVPALASITLTLSSLHSIVGRLTSSIDFGIFHII